MAPKQQAQRMPPKQHAHGMIPKQQAKIESPPSSAAQQAAIPSEAASYHRPQGKSRFRSLRLKALHPCAAHEQADSIRLALPPTKAAHPYAAAALLPHHNSSAGRATPPTRNKAASSHFSSSGSVRKIHKTKNTSKLIKKRRHSNVLLLKKAKITNATKHSRGNITVRHEDVRLALSSARCMLPRDCRVAFFKEIPPKFLSSLAVRKRS